MSTLRGFVGVLILIVFEFVFRCRCVDPPEQLKKCYDVGYNTFCFFRPACEYRRMTWEEAWQTCNRYNATLPAIPNQAAQKNFENYTKFLKPTYLNDFWMAGQEVRGLEWKWLNGSTANLYFKSGSLGDDDVQGVLTNRSKVPYTKDIPSNQNHFFCQMNGTACRSSDWISLSNGCVLINSSEVLNFYDARNRCVKDGGDLAVIDNDVDRQRLNEVISRNPNVARLWIGLRRQWWTWNATDSVVEMKYSNWRTNHGFKSNQTCMIVEMKEYKWQQESCDSLKHLVCQTGKPENNRSISRVLPAIDLIRIFMIDKKTITQSYRE